MVDCQEKPPSCVSIHLPPTPSAFTSLQHFEDCCPNSYQKCWTLLSFIWVWKRNREAGLLSFRWHLKGAHLLIKPAMFLLFTPLKTCYSVTNIFKTGLHAYFCCRNRFLFHLLWKEQMSFSRDQLTSVGDLSLSRMSHTGHLACPILHFFTNV